MSSFPRQLQFYRVLLKHRFIDQCEVKQNTCSYLAWKVLEFTANSCLLFLHARYPCQMHTRSIFYVFLIHKQQDQFIKEPETMQQEGMCEHTPEQHATGQQ